MKQAMHILSIILLIVLIGSCKVEPQTINFGQDHCNYCEMTIVDRTHATEYVTKKGKSFKFDAIECMIRELNENKNYNELAFILVTDFDNPGQLINAIEATYLVSDSIKSPMGANLSAFSSKDNGLKAQKKYSGKLYSWETIIKYFKK
jgi:copper chaperone NosL